MEAGRIKNPRQDTVRKLEAALKEHFPKDAAQELSAESSVAGLGELEDFDPNDESEWPLGAGVYVLYDISERPIYVGQGESVRKRLLDHREKFWFKQPLIQTGSFMPIKDLTLRRQVETLLIKFLRKNAILNKQNVDR
jgi:hypothetical protein